MEQAKTPVQRGNSLSNYRTSVRKMKSLAANRGNFSVWWEILKSLVISEVSDLRRHDGQECPARGCARAVSSHAR